MTYEITSSISLSFANQKFKFYPELIIYNGTDFNFDLELNLFYINILKNTFSLQKKLYEKFRKNDVYFFSFSQIISSIKCINGKIKKEIYPYIRIGVLKDDISLFREILITENIKSDILKISSYLYNDAIQLSNVIPLNQGKYNIAFSSYSSAYLIHEILGHLLEEDAPPIISKIYQNKKGLNKNFILIDDPYYSKLINYGEYDDAGKKYKKNTLIEHGKLINLISSTRKDFLENQDLNRMTNLVLINKELKKIKLPADYLYIDYVYHGLINYSTGEFHLFASLGKFKSQNKKDKYLKNIIISGSVFDLFDRIQIYDNEINYSLGTCIKKNQKLITGMAAPSLYIENLIVR